MLANLNDVLIPAKKGKYAVGLFNAVNLELARGIISAAEETGSPVIMGTAEVLDVYKRQNIPKITARIPIPIEYLAPYRIRERISRPMSSVPNQWAADGPCIAAVISILA